MTLQNKSPTINGAFKYNFNISYRFLKKCDDQTAAPIISGAAISAPPIRERCIATAAAITDPKIIAPYNEVLGSISKITPTISASPIISI